MSKSEYIREEMVRIIISPDAELTYSGYRLETGTAGLPKT